MTRPAAYYPEQNLENWRPWVVALYFVPGIQRLCMRMTPSYRILQERCKSLYPVHQQSADHGWFVEKQAYVTGYKSHATVLCIGFLETHDAWRQLLFSTYNYHDNRGIIMTITMMTFVIIAQHYSIAFIISRECEFDRVSL